jgi:hypothetical protein
LNSNFSFFFNVVAAVVAAVVAVVGGGELVDWLPTKKTREMGQISTT